ncbi:MAG: DUF3450 family protein [Wenzhouxiangellaceae bacterium]|nr:DUF3450 family protein [Wenzhouxiangellaceae bacterium]
MPRRFSGLTALAVWALLVSQAAAQDSLDALAEELVALRGEVESLNTELNRLQEQHQAEMNSLAAQKGDLEATERRETLRIRQLEQDLAENRQRAREAGVAGEVLVPVAEEIIVGLRQRIEEGFPFKRTERLDALGEIASQLESGALEPPRVVNRLWRFYEDELRLTRDSGLYSQIIPLGGDRVLADIAKVGAVALYFQTRDGRMGLVTRDGDDWRYTLAESGADRQRIGELFDSLKKQIRTGYFELPNGTIRLESGS